MCALLFKKPYLPNVHMLFPTASGACPLCGLRDTSGHMLGGCQLPHFLARYIAKHNTGVNIIYHTIQGSSGGMFCIMDPCPASDLPPGASATHVPEWLLPDESPAQRELYRPGLLLIPWLTKEMLSLLRFATPLL